MRSLHYLLLAAPWVILAAVAAVGLLTEPDPRGFGTHEQFGFSPCAFREWLGAPCPTCGVTTSVSHLAHGHLFESLRTQPLGLVLTMAALMAGPWSILAHRRGADLGQQARRLAPKFWALIAATVATCWVLTMG
jgi:hypothetical protein